MGMLAGRFAAHEALNDALLPPPPATTAHGALIEHITGGHLIGKKSFQPMNINFGLFPPVEIPARDQDGQRIKGKMKKVARKSLHCVRALDDFDLWLASQ